MQGVEASGHEPVRNWIMIKIIAVMARIFLILGGAPRFYSNFTDKVPILADLSVIKTHFTDKLPIFIDLSVNGSDFDKCSAAHHLLNYCTWSQLRAKRWFLRFARNLRTHCFGKGNWVEHFLNFGWFCSTFWAARAEFGVSGRTFFKILEILFYFLSHEGRIWSQW